METSAKYGVNIDKAFMNLVRARKYNKVRVRGSILRIMIPIHIQ